MSHRFQARATLLFDALMAIGLTAVLAATFSIAHVQLQKNQRLVDAKTELRRAAESELLRLRAGGLNADRAAAAPAPSDAAGSVSLDVRTALGSDEWSGMTLVTVLARRQVVGGWINVELSAYLPSAEVAP